MILGEHQQPWAACLREIDDAVSAMTTREVVLNAQFPHAPIPPDAIVYNLDLPGVHFCVDAPRYRGREIWDFSQRNCAGWLSSPRADDLLAVRHVPIGYHPSMERFARRPEEELDVDVCFTGFMNERRVKLFSDLRSRGLRVKVINRPMFGSERDEILARSRVAVNLLFYADGVFPVLRSAHLVANFVPTVIEMAPETPAWAKTNGAYRYEELEDAVEKLVLSSRETRESAALEAFEGFYRTPLVLPTHA